MSATAFGTVVLHISPEAAIGGPLATVQDGDMIELDVENKSIQLLIDDNELRRRTDNINLPEPHFQRGYGVLYTNHVEQAHLGCDFDFL